MSQWDLTRQGLGRLIEGLGRTVFGGVSKAAGVGTVAGGNPMGIPAILGGGTVDLWNAITNHTDDKGLDPIKDFVFEDNPMAYQIIDLVTIVTMGCVSYFSRY